MKHQPTSQFSGSGWSKFGYEACRDLLQMLRPKLTPEIGSDPPRKHWQLTWVGQRSECTSISVSDNFAAAGFIYLARAPNSAIVLDASPSELLKPFVQSQKSPYMRTSETKITNPEVQWTLVSRFHPQWITFGTYTTPGASPPSHYHDWHNIWTVLCRQCTAVHCCSLPSLREGRPYQNGWIFGKVPNGLWPPPPSFSENHVALFFRNSWPKKRL